VSFSATSDERDDMGSQKLGVLNPVQAEEGVFMNVGGLRVTPAFE